MNLTSECWPNLITHETKTSTHMVYLQVVSSINGTAAPATMAYGNHDIFLELFLTYF